MTRSGSRAHILGAALSAFLLATGVASRGLAAVDSAPVPLGDVNDDGEVSIVDALLLAQHNNGTDTGREYYLVNADLTADGNIDIVDALVISQYYVGLRTEFPVETMPHSFADPKLEAAARRALDFGPTDMISIADLRRIRALEVDCTNTGEPVVLYDVEGMLALENLTIQNCTIQGLESLEVLASAQAPRRPSPPPGEPVRPAWAPALTHLDLYNVSLGDISPLGALTHLSSLDLGWNQITDISPLANLPFLESLDLRMNKAVDLASLSTLTSLRELRVGWNVNLDLAPLAALTNLEVLDVRGAGLTDFSAVAGNPGLEIVARGRELITCRPGDLVGDYDGDGAFTLDDQQRLSSVLSTRWAFHGTAVFSDDIRCMDLDDSGTLDELDLQVHRKLVAGTLPDLGRLTLDCPPYALQGDVDGDGAVTDADVEVLDLVDRGEITVGQQICCADLNGDWRVDDVDRGLVAQLVQQGGATTGVCGDDTEGIGVMTYDLMLEPDYQDRDMEDTPLPIISNLHQRILANDMLAKTDVLVLTEYAYSNLQYPVELEYDDQADPPRFELLNSNPVTEMVLELQDLAAQHQLYMVVPLSESLLMPVVGRDPCPMIFNTALVINKQGDIEHVRRGMPFVSGCFMDEPVREARDQLRNDSFQVFSMETRTGRRFDSVVLICAEKDNTDFLQKVTDHDHPVGLILFPEGMANYTPGNDSMKRIQHFENASDFYEVYQTVENFDHYVPYAEYVVHAGLGIQAKRTQGTYALDRGPLPYVFTEQFDGLGYVYARVDPTEPAP